MIFYFIYLFFFKKNPSIVEQVVRTYLCVQTKAILTQELLYGLKRT